MPLKTHQSRGVAIAEALATATIWGTTFVATKIALEEVSPASVVWLRFGMGLLVLGLAAGLRGELSLPRSGDWAQLALLGFIGVALHQWLQANGLRTAAATTTAWIVASTPLFISLLAWLVLDERPSSIQWIGIGIAALGVVLVVSRGDPASLGLGRAIGVGDLLVHISAPNWAIYTIQLIEWCRGAGVLFMLNTTGMIGYFQRVFAKGVLPRVPAISANPLVRYPAGPADPGTILELAETADKGCNTAALAAARGIPAGRVVVMGDSGGDGPHFEWAHAAGAAAVGSMTKASLDAWCRGRGIPIRARFGLSYGPGQARRLADEMAVDFRGLIAVIEEILSAG